MTTPHGIATDEELARIRAKIGQIVTINEPPYLTEVTRDAVRQWAQATGDRNGLYTDEPYARASRHQSLLAPPCQLYAYSRISIGYRGGLPGVHSFLPARTGAGTSRSKWVSASIRKSPSRGLTNCPAVLPGACSSRFR